MTKFIELTYEGQKFSINVNYIIRVVKTKTGATLHFKGNGAFSVLTVEESYEDVKALIGQDNIEGN